MQMTVTFHTPYPNTPATLTIAGSTYSLTTTINGDLFMLEMADGTYQYTIVIAGKTYTGTVGVSGNNGYVDVTNPFPWTLALMVGGSVLAGLGVWWVLKH